MTKYANVRRTDILRLLLWLAEKRGVTIKSGGRHQILIKYMYWDRPFPIPDKHNEVNRFIVAALMEKLVASEICTQEEFDERIR